MFRKFFTYWLLFSLVHGQVAQAGGFRVASQGVPFGLGVEAIVGEGTSRSSSGLWQSAEQDTSSRLAHGALGAATGAIMDGARGARAGAIGAVVAETVAHAVGDDPETVFRRVEQRAQEQGISLEGEGAEDRFAALVQEETRSTVDAARLSGATAALLTGQSVGVADMTATNAVENNYATALVWGYRAYQAYRAGRALELAGRVVGHLAERVDEAAAAAQASEGASAGGGGGGAGAPEPDGPEEGETQENGRDRGNESADTRQFSHERRALVEMARNDRRRGITEEDMRAYQELNRELPDPFPLNMVRGPESHLLRGPHAQQWHGHVGPVDHIPISS